MVVFEEVGMDVCEVVWLMVLVFEEVRVSGFVCVREWVRV